MSAVEIEKVETSISTKLTLDSNDANPLPSDLSKSNENITQSKNSGEEIADTTSNKQRKKLNKLADSILRKHTNDASKLVTVEDKFYAMVQTCLDLQEQQKKSQLNLKENEKTVTTLNKQLDFVQAECNKALYAKEKLESLCRELQKHNKQIKEDNLQRIKEEEEKRKEITGKFQVAIDEINQQVSSNSEKNGTLLEENQQLATKLKNLIEQYEVREQHIEKILKAKDLEIELANAKLQQSELRLAESNERSKAEKSIYESHIIELNKKIEFHLEAEKQLKAQVAMYTEKYEDFQSTLKKSNSVFESFKSEMDKMTKRLKNLEKENTTWRSKWENSEKTLQSVIKQKDEIDKEIKKYQTKADIMEKLSRTLQTERNELKEKLKAYELTNNQAAANQSANNSNQGESLKAPNENNTNDQPTKEAESSAAPDDETKQDQQPNDYVIINQEAQNEQGLM